MNVQLFVPCFVDQLYPDTAFNVIKVLESLGCTVFYNENQTCCGQPAYNAGFIEESVVVAEKCMKDIKKLQMPTIVIGGSCTSFIKNDLPEILNDQKPNTINDEFANEIYEFTDFVVNILGVKKINSHFKGKVSIHDSCSALRSCGLKNETRILLNNIEGVEISEMKEAETCCGFGGTFAIKYKDISIAMAETKVESALEAGADYIVSTDLSCLMHIQGYIDNKKYKIKTLHIADILAQ